MNCCDYGCTRAPNCPAGSVVADKLLAGERLPELQPLYNHLHTENSDGSGPDADEPWLTGQRVLIGCGVFLAVCVAGFSTLLYFFR
ncbi:MAG: hypothetical protein B7Z68_07335 [Acidobacteria bacterium 21-70-11]|nr:MAG: hypothetical protein B7Z68_07335 [Acidobacteria bacterium 21-70-11]